ncbi:MAG: hypothetical protein DCC58_01860 [Chloroflexi bacterium]|nr:MAG: hypothetical protein DCC58_01860 [Chloroflexota bacterium]
MTVDQATTLREQTDIEVAPKRPPENRSPTPHVPAWKRPFLALDVPAFRNLWLGMLPGTMAMQMGMVTTGYVAYDISNSATAVGLVSTGWGIPMLLFGLVGGVVADRLPKRSILLATQTLIGVAAVLSAVLVLAGVIQVWHLIVIAGMQGLGFAFNMPARQAFVAQLVGREKLMNAVALNNAGMNFSRVVGPSIAGGLIGISVIGAGGVFVLMAAMYAFVVVSLLRIPQRGAPLGERRPSPLKSLGDGLRYVRGHAVVSTLLLLAFVPVMLGMPYQALMPVFAKDVFHVGPGGLGVLMTANGIGALAGSLTIASLSGFRRRGLLQMGLGIVFGGSLAMFAFSPSFLLAVVALLLVGIASAGFQSLNSSLVMDHADPAYHGRVMSVYMLTFSAMPLAVVPAGLLADAFGAPATIGIGGLCLLGIIATIGLVHPTYRHIR